LNQKSISHFLRKAGHDVATASDGKEVLDIIKRESFDVILMDVQMPELDGIEATKIIRADINPEIPIIAFTAYAMKGDRERMLEAGMTDYVSKPVQMDELLEKLRKIGSHLNY